MIKKYKLDNKGNGQLFTCNAEVYSGQSKFQKINIDDLELLGRVLVLDDIIQLSQLDCEIYHESFAHIPMSYTENATNVLVLGGGDGILAKELLKYDNLQIDLVDIDERVCELSKVYLKDLNDGALDDSRVNVYNIDALEFCKLKDDKTYDLILGDITDPHPESPSSSLLSSYALETYKRILKTDGVIAIQTDNVQVAPDHAKNIQTLLKTYYNQVDVFSIAAITLGGLFSFVCAYNKNKSKKIVVNTKWLTEERVKLSYLLNDYFKTEDSDG